MPYEMRRLYFSEAEVAAAVVAFNAQSKQKFLAPGGLDSVRLCEDPVFHVDVTVETAAGGRETVVLNETMIGAAIIRYCITTRVPLPLRSSKSVKVVNGQLVFDISLPRDHELSAGATRVAATM
jgi:hypothetical protein